MSPQWRISRFGSRFGFRHKNHQQITSGKNLAFPQLVMVRRRFRKPSTVVLVKDPDMSQICPKISVDFPYIPILGMGLRLSILWKSEGVWIFGSLGFVTTEKNTLNSCITRNENTRLEDYCTCTDMILGLPLGQGSMMYFTKMKGNMFSSTQDGR